MRKLFLSSASLLFSVGCLSVQDSKNPVNGRPHRETNIAEFAFQISDEAMTERIGIMEQYISVCCVGLLYDIVLYDLGSDRKTVKLLTQSPFKDQLDTKRLRNLIHEYFMIHDDDFEVIQMQTQLCKEFLEQAEHLVSQYATGTSGKLATDKIYTAFFKGENNWKRFYFILLASHFKQIFFRELTEALGLDDARYNAEEIDMRDEGKLYHIMTLFLLELRRRHPLPPNERD